MSFRKAFLLGVAGIALLTIMDAVIKGLAPRYALAQLVGLRFAAGAVFALAIVAVRRPPWPTPSEQRAYLWRGGLVVLTAGSFFYALATLPLAEAIALSFLAPVFTALFGALILREPVDRSVGLALSFGLAGMAVMTATERSGAPLPALGVAAALFSAVAYALNLVLLRRMAQTSHAATIVLFQNVVPALILAPFAALHWSMPSGTDVLAFLAAGALGTAGHLCMTTAFSRAEATRLAPVEYTALIWAAALGYVVFQEMPSPFTIAGAALIVIGSFIAMRR